MATGTREAPTRATSPRMCVCKTHPWRYLESSRQYTWWSNCRNKPLVNLVSCLLLKRGNEHDHSSRTSSLLFRIIPLIFHYTFRHVGSSHNCKAACSDVFVSLAELLMHVDTMTWSIYPFTCSPITSPGPGPFSLEPHLPLQFGPMSQLI